MKSTSGSRSDGGESVQLRLGRLRLEAARKQHNKLKSHQPFRRNSSDDLHANSSAGLGYLRFSSTATQNDALFVSGPVPHSWRPLYRSFGKCKLVADALTLPCADLKDPLIRYRFNILHTLCSDDEPPWRPFTSLNLSLSCLAWLALDLRSDQPASLDCVTSIPVHLKEKLASLASLISPLDDPSARALFSSDIDSRTEHAGSISTWEESDIEKASDHEALEYLNLGFSSISLTTLQKILYRPDLSLHYPFLSRLNLSGSVHISCSFTLIQSLSGLINLQHLSLAQVSILSAVDQATWSIKLAQATPRLITLDLSYNNWIKFRTIQAIEWSEKWKSLEALALKECNSIDPPPSSLKRIKSIGSGFRMVAPALQDNPRSGMTRRIQPKEEPVAKMSSENLRKALNEVIMAKRASWIDVVV